MKVDDKLLKRSLSTAIDFSMTKKEGFKDKVRKFDETIDLIINIKDVNLNDPKNRIDKEIILSHEVITEEKPKEQIDYTLLRFLKKTPPLVGIDLLNYGPFEKEDIAYIPSQNAKILIFEKFTEKVELS